MMIKFVLLYIVVINMVIITAAVTTNNRIGPLSVYVYHRQTTLSLSIYNYFGYLYLVSIDTYSFYHISTMLFSCPKTVNVCMLYSAWSYDFSYTDLVLLTTPVLVVNFPRNQPVQGKSNIFSYSMFSTPVYIICHQEH